ncbi:MAG: polysaccharide biosynthesis C-terminal domain-containing protein, partial [Alicyclobacillus sp.]|nr:polysaccharide biosynthesis C-terminal domain-containing protein [Alicyclobacillus sp.]
LGYSTPVAAAGAAFGAVTGAAAGLLWLLRCWGSRPRPAAAKRADAPGWLAMSRQLVYYAFPISLGALVVPLMNNVDVVTVVNLLKGAGEGQLAATTDFGLLTGRAFKLMMFPTTLASGIGIAVMPAVSEAFTLGFRKLMSDRIDMAIRLTILLSLPAAMGLALLAEPVDIALFKDAAGAPTIEIMAIATVFASLQMTIAAVLQGSGWVYLPVLNLLAAGMVKLACNLLLVPTYGIRGAAAATVISYLTATVLNMVSMARCLGERMRWRNWVLKPTIATFIMSAAVFAAERQWLAMGGLDWARVWVALACCAICGIGVAVYLAALLAAGGLSAKELESVPRFGPQLVVWCSRIGLLR